MTDVSPRTLLRRFLVDHLSARGELELFAADHFEGLRHRVDWNGSLAETADRFLTVVLDAGHGADLWPALRAERQRLLEEIDVLERRYAGATDVSAVEPDFPAFVAALHDDSPYRGLLPFREEHAEVFFGREGLTRLLLDAVRQHALVAVVGSSGSGKSSVVSAGLVPALRSGTDGVWDVVRVEPRSEPFRELAEAFAPRLYDGGVADRLREQRRLAEYLAAGEVLVSDVVKEALAARPGVDRLLLLVDQWEQLYALESAESVQFVDSVLESLSHDDVTVVLTLRSDFYGEALAHRGLADALQGAVVNVGLMTREEAKQAVEAPAAAHGARFEPGLVDRVLDDLGEAGNLPLLQFVAGELWRRHRSDLLTHADYLALGTAHGAIASRADQAIAELGADEAVVRDIFLRVVRPGGGTRRPAKLGELGEKATGLVRSLARERLLVVGSDADGTATYELAHEALIECWAPLEAWIEDDREFLAWRQRLDAAMEAWEDENRHRDALLRGMPLAVAEAWSAQRPDTLSEAERTFVATSRREADRAVLEAEAGLQLGIARVMAFRTTLIAMPMLAAAGIAVWYALAESAWGRTESFLTSRPGMTLFLAGPIAILFLGIVAIVTLSSWLGASYSVATLLDPGRHDLGRVYTRAAVWVPGVNFYRPNRIVGEISGTLVELGHGSAAHWARLNWAWTLSWGVALLLGFAELVAFASGRVSLEQFEPALLIASAVAIAVAVAATTAIVHRVTSAFSAELDQGGGSAGSRRIRLPGPAG